MITELSFLKTTLKTFRLKIELHLNHATAEKHFNNFLNNGKQPSMMHTNPSTKKTLNPDNL